MKTLRYGAIHSRCIHYFEILKFEVYSLFSFFPANRFTIYADTRTPHATATHLRQVTHPYAQVMRQSVICNMRGISLCKLFY